MAWIFPLAAALWLLAHEAAHAGAAWALGAQVTGFRPWPHRVDGRLYFGRVTWRGALSPRRRALAAGAPILLGLFAWAVLWQAPLGVFGPVLIDLTRGLLMPVWTEDRGDLNRALPWLSRPARCALGGAAVAIIVGPRLWACLA